MPDIQGYSLTSSLLSNTLKMCFNAEFTSYTAIGILGESPQPRHTLNLEGTHHLLKVQRSGMLGLPSMHHPGREARHMHFAESIDR